MRGDVYRNLNDECLSVLDRRTDSDEYGRVVGHVDTVYVLDAEVVTYENKRQQALESGQKNVHAMFRGKCRDCPTINPGKIIDSATRIEYRPDREGCFYTPDDEQVIGAPFVSIDLETGIHALDVETVDTNN